MNRLKRLCVVLMCFGFSLVYAAAQTQPAASPPAAAPTPPLPPGKTDPAPLPDPQTPEEFFARARALSDLEASGISFHLKATYVASGDTEFTGNGTYEEWWQSKDLWRKEAALGDYRYVAIENDGKPSVHVTSTYIPLRLRQMLDAVVIRITPGSGSARDWKLKHKKMNGVDLSELSVERPCGISGKCVAADYFSTQGLLRIHVDDLAQKLYNEFQEFHGVSIPRSIVMAGVAGPMLTISVTSVEPLTPSESQLLQGSATSPDLPLIMLPSVDNQKELMSDKVTRSRITDQIAPIYPRAAAQKQLEGTVVIEATIDEDGRVREPFIISSPGPLLDMAAMDAVKRWRFRPLFTNGVPICVETTMTVAFHYRP
ncbi:MAG: energy transducer TonB [Acidobacteriaceae bacterium]